MGLRTRLIKSINRRKVARLVKNPPAIDDNKIVFFASTDYSDNALALYEYMVEAGIDKKYDIVWLVRDTAFCKKRNPGRARFVKVKDDNLRMWTAAAQREAMSAKYLFFTHGMNWVKVMSKAQTYVNLWHGCGYKGQNRGGSAVAYFDLCLITGPKYIDIQERFFECDREKLLPIGYPRSDWFRTNRSNAKSFIESLRQKHSASKVILWMPTYRAGASGRLDDSTYVNETGLPLIGTPEELDKLNEQLKANDCIIVIKIHHLQKAYSLDGLSNIICLDDDQLRDENVYLYELMAQTDSLLSDYSSVSVDYMLLDKPLGYILDDFDSYNDVRGFSFDNVKDYMPGHHIYNISDFFKYVSDIGAGVDPYRSDRLRINPEVNVESDCYSADLLNYLGIGGNDTL